MEPRERILLKAHELFTRFGFKRVTMDEIAAKTGISKKTIYQSFATKDDVVDAVVTNILAKNEDTCRANEVKALNAVHENFLNIDMVQELMEEMNPTVFEDLQRYFPVVFEKVFRHKVNFIEEKVRKNLERGVTEGVFRPEIDVDIITKYRVETLFIPMNSSVFPHGKYKLLDIEYEIMQHYLYGVCTTEGRKLIVKYKAERQKPLK